ncbi:alpha beta-hydrolase protein [Rutstroemia sp. NJR-2017a BBW]|nr:alpha beta-hydrolase protein [Rutstroemia sp. NJR-2017a BBW]
MHSYGGQVGSDALVGLGTESRAAQGLSGDIVKKFGHMDLVPLAFNFAEDDTCVNNDPKQLLVGPSALAEEEVDKYLATLVRWNGKAMYLPIKNAAWREIPVGYIHSTMDMTVPFDYQKSFVEGMEKEGRPVQTVELATGHSPNFTDTEGVVDAINKIING